MKKNVAATALRLRNLLDLFIHPAIISSIAVRGWVIFTNPEEKAYETQAHTLILAAGLILLPLLASG